MTNKKNILKNRKLTRELMTLMTKIVYGVVYIYQPLSIVNWQLINVNVVYS